MVIAQARIALVDALHVQSAELWLRLGEPLQALRELERLSRRARRHPWAEAVFMAAFGTLREPGYFQALGSAVGRPTSAEPCPGGRNLFTFPDGISCCGCPT